MVEKCNKEFLRESITISICVEDNVQFPYISIDKDYKKFVTVTDKIQEAAMNG